jgi:hypothetical protein
VRIAETVTKTEGEIGREDPSIRTIRKRKNGEDSRIENSQDSTRKVAV